MLRALKMFLLFIEQEKAGDVEVEGAGVELEISFIVHVRDHLKAAFFHGDEITVTDTGTAGKIIDLKTSRNPGFPEHPTDVSHREPPRDIVFSRRWVAIC
jgi:hypothetical protein